MTTEPHPVEVAILCAVALLWAFATLARFLLIALAVLLTLARHRPIPQAPQPARPAPAAASPAAAPAMPAPSLSGLAEALLGLPAAELRELAGIRRRCSKAEAVAQLLALPI